MEVVAEEVSVNCCKMLQIFLKRVCAARSLREACLHWSDAHGEKDSLSSGVAGAQIRCEIPSAFVAQSLLSAGSFARLAWRHVAEFRVRLFSIGRPARLIVRKSAFQHGSPICLMVYRPIGSFPPAWKSIVRRLLRGRFVGSASEIRVQLPERADHHVKLRHKVPLD